VTLSMLRTLLFIAAVTNGILVGGAIDRALIGFPAWRAVGPQAWATFSRHADLVNGRVWYPLWAFAGMICSVAAAVLVTYRSAPFSAACQIAVDAGALFTIGGLLLTLKAAPIMLGLRAIDNDPVALQRAFEGFSYWSYWRLGSQSIGWMTNLCALIALAAGPPVAS
jgi:hypothetical protein